jgi:uncharacterized membrane protein
MKLFGTASLYLLALGVAAYAVFAYAFLPLGSLVHPTMQLNFLAHRAGIYTHVFAAVVALLFGPLQFSGWLRRNRPRVHRVLGRAYLGIGVGLGGLAGLYMSFFAFDGLVVKIGFGSLAVIWLFTGFRAYRAIRRGAVQEHRQWIIRNFSLTLAAVTLRIYLPLTMLAGIPFVHAYPFLAWLSWVPNLLIAELALAGSSGTVFRASVDQGIAQPRIGNCP